MFSLEWSEHKSQLIQLSVKEAVHTVCLFGIKLWQEDFSQTVMMVLVLSSPLLSVQYIPVMLLFTLLVYAVTAAHHYGAA